MNKSKTKSIKKQAKEKFEEQDKKNKFLIISVLFIVGIILVIIIFKIIQRRFWVFMSIEIILTVGFFLTLALSKKVKEIWMKLPQYTRIFTIILPLALIGLTGLVRALEISPIPNILQIGKSTNPTESSSEDPLVFLYDNYTTTRTHTLELEVEGDTLLSVDSTGGHIPGDSYIYINFYKDEDNPELIFSDELISGEMAEYCSDVVGSDAEGMFYTHFYWNASNLFVPELETMYIFTVEISDYEGDVTEGEQWFYYLEDYEPLNIGDYKWIIIGVVFGVILLVLVSVSIRRKKKKKKKKES